MRKVVLFIAMSIDGYIATEDHDLTWLNIAEKEGEDYGYKALYDQADTYIVGRKTYDIICSFTDGKLPQAENMDCYILTKQDIPSQNNITFYNQDLETLISKLKQKEGKTIVCDGGSEVVKLLMEKNLIDEYIITVIPTILGSGIPLFKGGIDPIKIKAQPSKYFDNGVVQLHYTKEAE
ncbi:dihydrofolate reductase family protein [Halosquirtibacter laminarini]|uniref:Dihydrofolate reductase family protein n=1 Tax=Halosquirtibacter laminarini TaxID=3374600 RepID=A0AC61NFV5_9BACT|nr:dihydrofolate reductase family protein [Prolixibacteraceae bacterium]